jgi:hypothetical protein
MALLSARLKKTEMSVSEQADRIAALRLSTDTFVARSALVALLLGGAALAWRLCQPAALTSIKARRAPQRVAARTLTTISDRIVPLPASAQLIHLQFRRFAGCPVCNLHLRTFIRRNDELQRAAIQEVVIFCSSRDELRAYAGDLPFAIVADPERVLYAEFGVGTSPSALLDPRAWGAIVRGVARSAIAFLRGRERLPPMRPQQGSLGLPADFLVAPDGRVIASKYGRHADDQWSVDEVLGFAATALGSGCR